MAHPPVRTYQGFTLLELIIVIIILAIVAIVAAPRFFDFHTDARIAALRGMAGAINAAVPMTRSKCELDAVCNVNEAANNTVRTRICLQQNCAPTEFIRTHYGYPNASEAGIDRILANHEYTVTGSGTQRNFRPKGVATSNNNCRIRYIRATNGVSPPTVDVFTSGC